MIFLLMVKNRGNHFGASFILPERTDRSEEQDSVEPVMILYTDGGARGNPGPAAVAYAIFDSKGDLIEKGGQFLGTRTNNEAEYEALLWGIEKVRETSCVSLRVVSDSELMVKQINGEYRVKEDRLRRYADLVRANKRLFEFFEVVHARREDPRIEIVDALVNKVLEEKGHPKR
jgi:ribonuclease HI